MKWRFRLGVGTGPQPGEGGGQVAVRACTGAGSQTLMAFREGEGRRLYDGGVGFR